MVLEEESRDLSSFQQSCSISSKVKRSEVPTLATYKNSQSVKFKITSLVSAFRAAGQDGNMGPLAFLI